MIRLKRGGIYELKAYEIFIDGVYRGDIKNNETKEYAVDNGSHIIYAKIGCFRSNKLSVDIDNSATELEIITKKKQLGLSFPYIWFVTLFYLITFSLRNKELLIIKKI